MSEEIVDGEQQEQAPPKIVLKAEQIVAGLSQVSKTYDGASYAFTNLVLEEKELEELGDGLRQYSHLRIVSLAKNQLKDLSELTYMPHLLSLNVAENQVPSIDFLAASRDSLNYLQQLTLTKNKLTALPSIPQPRLARLLLNENEIATCAAFGGHATLTYLDLSKNKLTSVASLCNMPKLQHLDLSENELTDVKGGLAGLTDLRKLIFTKNKIASLEQFGSFPALSHLVLIENQLADVKQLAHVGRNGSIRQIDMMENPAVAEKADGFKTEVLIVLLESAVTLRKLNEEDITDEDRTNAVTEKANRIKAEEDARREAAEKAAAAAEGGVPAEDPAE